MLPEIRIRNKLIGENRSLFIIAEIGITCNYEMEIAKELIDAAREAGADAVKFIFWFPEEIMSDKNVTYSYETVNGLVSENMFDMLNKLRFTLDEWHEIKRYADNRDIIMFSTVNSPSGIDYAESLGLEAYKLSSWDYNYFPLWRKIAALGKPMVIDTGPVNTLEVAKVVQLMKEAGNEQYVFLHCFHTDNPVEMNMRAIPYLKKAFHALAGFSAEGLNDDMDIMAVALGSVVLEKRLTLSRSLPGHHHVISKEPAEFVGYVKKMREAHAALGVHDLRPSPADLAIRRTGFRRIVANQDIPQGTRLTPEMLEGKRPEGGVSPEYLDFFIGKVIKRDLKYNETLSWDDI